MESGSYAIDYFVFVPRSRIPVGKFELNFSLKVRIRPTFLSPKNQSPIEYQEQIQFVECRYNFCKHSRALSSLFVAFPLGIRSRSEEETERHDDTQAKTSMYVKGNLTERSVLLAENVEASCLEGHVVGGDDVPVRGQVQPVVKLAEEVRDAGVRLWQRLEHHLGLGAPMLG